jgi:hypothetical protein
MRSLKSQILTLWCRGRSYDEIVEALGCSRDYVRASVSRAKHGGRTPGDIENDKRKAHYRAERILSDPDYRRRWAEYCAKWRAENREHYNAYRREYQRRRRAEAAALDGATAPLGGSRAVKTQDATEQARARRSETHQPLLENS